jgi:DNA sulfur modification protein DndB
MWEAILEGITPFTEAIKDPPKIPGLRKDEAPTSLLFKPAAQIGLIDGILRAVVLGKITLSDAVARANRIPDWSMGADIWRDIIIKSGGTIDAGADARERMALLVCYLVAADRLSVGDKANIWRRFAAARGDDSEGLPQSVEGEAFTADAAKAILATLIPKAA